MEIKVKMLKNKMTCVEKKNQWIKIDLSKQIRSSDVYFRLLSGVLHLQMYIVAVGKSVRMQVVQIQGKIIK